MQRRRILFPLGNLMLPSATLNSLGGGCFVQLRQEQQNVNKNAQRKVFRSMLLQYHSFSFFSNPENVQGEKPMEFSPIDLGSWPRVYPIPSNWADPSCRNRCPQQSQSAREDFWERQEIANVKNKGGGNPKKNQGVLPIFPWQKSPNRQFFSGRCL